MQRIGISLVRSFAVAALAAALALTATPAHAAKCARPGGGGGCKSTIQAAVDAAVAHETVYVHPGRYKETVLIPGGKDALELVGLGSTPGAVRIEASGLGAAGIGVQSDGVLVRNLTVRGGTAGIIANRPGLRVSRVQVLGARGPCIDVLGNSASITASRFNGCNGQGIMVTGADALVRGVSTTLSGGILIAGDRARVIDSRVTSSNAVGIYVTGATPLVKHNRVRSGSGPAGIAVLAAGAPPAVTRVIRNRIAGVGGLAIQVAGPILVSGNVVQKVAGYGVYFNCLSDCAEGRLGGNVVNGTLIGGMAFFVQSSGIGLEVAGNRAVEGGGAGFNVTASGADVHDNEAIGCGAIGQPGLFVYGDSNSLRRNLARGNRGGGFMVTGSSNTLAHNRAEGNYLHGFVDGAIAPASGTVFNGNRAVGNVDYGFHLAAGSTGATVTNNTASANSYSPFCVDGGAPAAFSGNSFSDSICMH